MTIDASPTPSSPRADSPRRLGSTAEVRSSQRYCYQITRQARSSFSMAFRVLPPAKREAMHVLYAFLRLSDDLADEEGRLEVKKQRLTDWRAGLHRAIEEHEYTHPVHPALVYTLQQFAISPRWLDEVLDGVASDLDPIHFETFEDLQAYCYRVASAVGLACIPIWGYSGDIEAPAVAAGIAFQLTNILRDLGEDLDRGRVYLPQCDLRVFGSDPQTWRGRPESFRKMMRFQVERARDFYRQAEPLDTMLSHDGRAIYSVMRGDYRRLLEHIEKNDYDVFSRRLRVARITRLRLLLSAWPRKWGWI